MGLASPVTVAASAIAGRLLSFADLLRFNAALYHPRMTAPTRIPGRRLLHSPGPTPLPDEVLHALMRQPMDMGDPRVDETIAACEQGLKRLLQERGVKATDFADWRRIEAAEEAAARTGSPREKMVRVEHWLHTLGN